MKMISKRPPIYTSLYKLIWIAICFFGIIGCNSLGGDINKDFTIDAGEDQVINFGSSIEMQVFDTYAGVNSLAYEWELVESPSTSTYALSDPSSSSFSFTPDVLGAFTFKITVTETSENVETDEVTITAIKAPVLITGTIESATNWSDVYEENGDPDYRVSGCIYVNAPLTIEEGVHIIFEEGACITVQSAGSIQSNGSIDKPVLMTGVQAAEGFWRGIEIESQNANNRLDYTIIEYAGFGGFDGVDLHANLFMNGGTLNMTNSIIRYSSEYGIMTRKIEDKFPVFENNIITNNKIPILTNMNQYDYLNATNDFTGNDNDYIDSHNNWAIERNATWPALNIPYRLIPNICVLKSDITIEKGAHFIGQSNSGIVVHELGSLQAIGTADDPILFTGVNQIRGDWRGIQIISNTLKNQFDYVVISDGGEGGFDGSGYKTNLILYNNARLKMTNSTISNGAGSGLMTRNDEVVLADFSNNTITGNARAVNTLVVHFQYFDDSSDFAGNDEDGIYTHTKSSNTSTDETWKVNNVPYVLGYWHVIDSHITIEAGVQIVGLPGSGLQVKSDGSLNAIGFPDKRIVFRGEENVQGYWKGLRLESNSANNVLDYVTISNGGESGFDGAGIKANMEIFNLVVLSNSIISDSKGYGIYVNADSNFSNINNTYINNQDDDVFYE